MSLGGPSKLLVKHSLREFQFRFTSSAECERTCDSLAFGFLSFIWSLAFGFVSSGLSHFVLLKCHIYMYKNIWVLIFGLLSNTPVRVGVGKAAAQNKTGDQEGDRQAQAKGFSHCP